MSVLSRGNGFGGGVLPQLWLGRGSLDKVAYHVFTGWLAGGLRTLTGHGLCRGGGKKVRGQIKALGEGDIGEGITRGRFKEPQSPGQP